MLRNSTGEFDYHPGIGRAGLVAVGYSASPLLGMLRVTTSWLNPNSPPDGPQVNSLRAVLFVEAIRVTISEQEILRGDWRRNGWR